MAGLAEIREDGPGWTRRVFGDADRCGRVAVAELMRGAGLEVVIDPAGNVIGTLSGEGPSGGPVLVTGSHTDTVAGGGRFDGVVGVLGAVEAVRTLRESGVRLHHELRVVDFLGEEPNDYGLSCVGSRALSGLLEPAHLDRRLLETSPGGTTAGLRLGDSLRLAGGDPEGALRSAWSPGSVLAYLELHIEQGPHLEALSIPLGVVLAIVGIQRLEVSYRGRQDHAGTMPMHLRHDAGCAAAAGMLAVERLAQGNNVATVGQIELSPGAVNVVPGLARLGVESRSADPEWLTEFRARLSTEVAVAAAARGVEVDVASVSLEPPTPMTASLAASLTDTAASLGHPTTPLASFAGHDAAMMAAIGPAAMLFVPSKGGRSHCPEEWTDVADIATGVHTLAETLRRLDRDGMSAPPPALGA